MRVFCSQHKTSFFTPRRNPIRCENRGHVLGEFIFHGDARAPVDTLWQYCCNCEHFSPIELTQSGLETCPACARRISQIYVCDQCFTASFESSTPTDAKNFTLTSDGAPQPSCGGCLQESSGELREHDCERLGARFTTALDSCPICLERVDVGPAFPAPVAQYLKKTKAASKSNVTFNYLTGLFVPVDDGEFVLVTDRNQSSRAVVVPRATRFESKADFYEFYQDYYHCRNVNAGEVHVIEPALVERSDDGWKLLSMGVLEIAGTPPLIEKPRRPAVVASQPPPETITVSRPEPANDPEPTVPHDVTTDRPPIFAWAVSPEPPEPSPTSSRLSLIALGVIGVLLVTLGAFLVKGLVSQFGPSADAQQVTANLHSQTDAAPKIESTTGATAESRPAKNQPTNTADEELQKLRERRIDASPSDRLTILRLCADTERQYPNDYRFPYERAKLAIDSRETKSHHEAFDALSLAAEEAIESNKAQEMLADLEADESGDFHKLAHGHHEWAQIMEALKRKDATLLTSN